MLLLLCIHTLLNSQEKKYIHFTPADKMCHIECAWAVAMSPGAERAHGASAWALL